MVALAAAPGQFARQLQAHVLRLGRSESVGQVLIRPGGQGPAFDLPGGRVCGDLALGGLLLGWRTGGNFGGLRQGIGLLGLGSRTGIHGQGSSGG
ncbi:hypothetical protein, partial [Delftia acidovorans]|uniref:hypothetical protein n=1 Tax=Delftia acidovorans TaxID=80866 RepID=UPI0035A00D80